MRYNGSGIYGSNNGGATWKELMTQDGINANYINAGTINAGKVSITDGGRDITTLNADGLVIKKQANQPYTLGALNTSSTGIAKAFDNVTVFVGRDANGNGVGYFDGYVNASKGGNIGGWTIASNALHTSNNNLYLGTSGITAAINGTNRSNLVFKAGSKFGVSSDGTMYASGANIQGDISATSLTLSSSIKIGENNLTLTNTEALINAQKVRIDAHDTAIAGRVTFSDLSTSGKTTIHGGNITTGKISASYIDADNLKVKGANVTGALTAATISGSNISGGTITGTTISGNSIYCGWNDTEQSYRTQLLSNGVFKYYNGVGFLVCGYASGGTDNTTKHPYISGLNVARGAGGIGFWTGGYMTDLGSRQAYVSLDSNNQLNIYGSKGVDFASGQNMNISAGDALGIDPWTYCAIRTGDAKITPSDKSIYLKCGSGGTGNITLYTDYGSVYAKGNGLSNAKVLTDQGSASSKNVKENIEPFTNEKYDNALKLLSNINIYSYDYKYGLYSNHPHQYGFLIDEIEEQNGYSDFFNFHEEKGFVQDGFINHNMDDWKKGTQIIKLKKYDTDVLDKYLLTCVKALQNKIDELQQEVEQLKKEKAN